MATYYWVGGSGTWDDTTTTNWSASSGGSGGAGVPTITDAVIFDSSSGTGNVTVSSANCVCLSISTTGSSFNFLTSGTPTVPGLAGKFFNGDWRSTISTGNIGTLPLNSTNNSSNVTGTGGMPSAAHRYGVNLWPYITYDSLGDLYGFIAIGYFTPPSTGTYTFYTSSDDGSGVWIGDIASATTGRTAANAVVNNNLGGGQGNTKRSGTISLNAGVRYPIRIVHEEGNGGDNLTFSWSGPGIAETTSLATYFTTPGYSSSSLIGDFVSYGVAKITVAGNITLSATTTMSNYLTLSVSANSTITTNGSTISILDINGSGVTATLAANTTILSTVLSQGTLNLNSKRLTTSTFNTSLSNTKTLAFGTGDILVNGYGTVWSMSANGFSYTGTPTVNIFNTSSNTVSVSTGALSSSQALNFNVNSGSFTYSDGTSYYNDLNLTGFVGSIPNNNRTIYGTLTLPSGVKYSGPDFFITNYLDNLGDLSIKYVTKSYLMNYYSNLIPAMNNNTFYSWGLNNYGQLGLNNTDNQTAPVLSAGGNSWKQISVGQIKAPPDTYNAAGIKTDGSMWVWGLQLADGTTSSRRSPVSVSGGGAWKQVAMGSGHGVAIKSDNTAWSWGSNNRGQLGTGNGTYYSSPVSVVGGFTNWNQISCGYYAAAGIRDNGTLWTWGYNGYGQIGDNTTSDRNSPVTTSGGGSDWKQVSVGMMCAAAIKQDGTMWSWGYNTYGQLGVGTTSNYSSPVSVIGNISDWKQVSCGHYTTTAITKGGLLYTWGLNNYGQVGDGSTTNKNSPTLVAGGGTNWKQASCGYNHTAAIKTDGTLWTWGRNDYNQLGDSTVTNRYSPITPSTGTGWKQVAAGVLFTLGIYDSEI